MELESSIGFLEQTMSNIIIRALTSLDDLKDRLKHPRLTVRQTALMYVALFFKAWDPNAPVDTKHRQQERLKVCTRGTLLWVGACVTMCGWWLTLHGYVVAAGLRGRVPTV